MATQLVSLVQLRLYGFYCSRDTELPIEVQGPLQVVLCLVARPTHHGELAQRLPAAGDASRPPQLRVQGQRPLQVVLRLLVRPTYHGQLAQQSPAAGDASRPGCTRPGKYWFDDG